jgi:hypothetical protein
MDEDHHGTATRTWTASIGPMSRFGKFGRNADGFCVRHTLVSERLLAHRVELAPKVNTPRWNSLGIRGASQSATTTPVYASPPSRPDARPARPDRVERAPRVPRRAPHQTPQQPITTATTEVSPYHAPVAFRLLRLPCASRTLFRPPSSRFTSSLSFSLSPLSAPYILFKYQSIILSEIQLPSCSLANWNDDVTLVSPYPAAPFALGADSPCSPSSNKERAFRTLIQPLSDTKTINLATTLLPPLPVPAWDSVHMSGKSAAGFLCISSHSPYVPSERSN